MLMPSENPTEKVKSRLRVLVESCNGFEIAQKDLEMRGLGEITGTRQSGIGELDMAEIMRHHSLLLKAKREAQELATV